jgi:hypothetical protein
VLRGKGLAVESGLEVERANLIDDIEISHVDVHAGVLVELPLRAQQGEPGGDGA